jgi:hypothetical protein
MPSIEALNGGFLDYSIHPLDLVEAYTCMPAITRSSTSDALDRRSRCDQVPSRQDVHQGQLVRHAETVGLDRVLFFSLASCESGGIELAIRGSMTGPPADMTKTPNGDIPIRHSVEGLIDQRSLFRSRRDVNFLLLLCGQHVDAERPDHDSARQGESQAKCHSFHRAVLPCFRHTVLPYRRRAVARAKARRSNFGGCFPQ